MVLPAQGFGAAEVAGELGEQGSLVAIVDRLDRLEQRGVVADLVGAADQGLDILGEAALRRSRSRGR